MKQNHPELKTYEIAREIGKSWRGLSEGERRQYQKEYEMEKAEYYERVNAYNRSPAYQQYLGELISYLFLEIKIRTNNRLNFNELVLMKKVLTFSFFYT